MSPRRLFVLVLLSTLAAPALGCKKVADKIAGKYQAISSLDKAKQRVTGILDGVQKGGDGTSAHVQRAICLWYNGSYIIRDLDLLAKAWQLYTAWQNEAGIGRYISGFTVTGAELSGDGAILVSGTIEGRLFTVKVVEGKPVSWVKIPK